MQLDYKKQLEGNYLSFSHAYRVRMTNILTDN